MSDWLNSKYPQDLLTNMLVTDLRTIVRQWIELPKEKQANLALILLDALSLTRQTMTAQVATLTANQKLFISPLTGLALIEAATRATSRADFLIHLKNFNIPASDFKLSEFKTYAVNCLDALEKIYLCFTVHDAYIYVQVAHLIAENKITLTDEQLSLLIVSRSNISMILNWYRLIYLLDDRAVNYDNDTQMRAAGLNDLPSLALTMQVVEDAAKLISSYKLFPKVMMGMLQEQNDLTSFYILIDAITIVLQDKKLQDEFTLRQKIAHNELVADIINDNASWNTYLDDPALLPLRR